MDLTIQSLNCRFQNIINQLGRQFRPYVAGIAECLIEECCSSHEFEVCALTESLASSSSKMDTTDKCHTVPQTNASLQRKQLRRGLLYALRRLLSSAFVARLGVVSKLPPLSAGVRGYALPPLNSSDCDLRSCL